MNTAMIALLLIFSRGFVQPKTPAPEKIWTNYRVEALRNIAPISIIGLVPSAETPATISSANQITAAGRPYAPYVKEKDPAWYTEEVETRRAQIAQAETQIKLIQNIRATGVGISSAISLTQLSVGMTPESTIEILQGQARELHTQVENFQDEARRNGILPIATR